MNIYIHVLLLGRFKVPLITCFFLGSSHTRHAGAYLWSVDAQGEWSIVSREVQLLGIFSFGTRGSLKFWVQCWFQIFFIILQGFPPNQPGARLLMLYRICETTTWKLEVLPWTVRKKQMFLASNLCIWVDKC